MTCMVNLQTYVQIFQMQLLEILVYLKWLQEKTIYVEKRNSKTHMDLQILQNLFSQLINYQQHQQTKAMHSSEDGFQLTFLIDLSVQTVIDMFFKK